ncbi:MAG TPA: hypothetical protein VFW58_10720 [Trichococcus sp.]|nr:hypothetical protein [Trichococcus sp.]
MMQPAIFAEIGRPVRSIFVKQWFSEYIAGNIKMLTFNFFLIILSSVKQKTADVYENPSLGSKMWIIDGFKREYPIVKHPPSVLLGMEAQKRAHRNQSGAVPTDWTISQKNTLQSGGSGWVLRLSKGVLQSFMQTQQSALKSTLQIEIFFSNNSCSSCRYWQGDSACQV